jgi:quinoprotein glucose dehydrogenase
MNSKIAVIIIAGVACIVSAAAIIDPRPAKKKPHTEWSDYGGGPDQSKFVDLTQINKQNIGQLQLDHVYASGDKEYYKFNPIIVDGIMYVLAKNNSLVALDPATGKEIYLYVLDRETGKPIWPIVETPVPASDMPNEKAWPTQPIPTVIPPFTKHVALLSDLNPYFTPEEKATWGKRLAAAKSAPFQPLSDQYETVSIPGAFGGANFENTASNPDKGIVYVLFSNEPCVYQLKKVDHTARGNGMAARAAQAAAGKNYYAISCQACHGADQAGVPGNGPSLLNLGSRVNANEFKLLVSQGKGRMPAQPHLDEATISAIYSFLAPPTRGSNVNIAPIPVSGPVVADGPAPIKPTDYTAGMKDYPAGYTGPRAAYAEVKGNGISVANLLTPPWCGIACYDLNQGILKWTIGHGTDPKVGIDGLGYPGGSSGKGMVVTASGLLFATSRDGHLYCYDADSGNKLWVYDLQRDNPNGVPAMFEKDGRQYLVVVSCGPLRDKNLKEEDVPRGYLIFALPKKSN